MVHVNVDLVRHAPSGIDHRTVEHIKQYVHPLVSKNRCERAYESPAVKGYYLFAKRLFGAGVEVTFAVETLAVKHIEKIGAERNQHNQEGVEDQLVDGSLIQEEDYEEF